MGSANHVRIIKNRQQWGVVVYSLLLEYWFCLHGYLAGMEETTDHLTLVMVFAVNRFIKVIKHYFSRWWIVF